MRQPDNPVKSNFKTQRKYTEKACLKALESFPSNQLKVQNPRECDLLRGEQTFPQIIFQLQANSKNVRPNGKQVQESKKPEILFCVFCNLMELQRVRGKNKTKSQRTLNSLLESRNIFPKSYTKFSRYLKVRHF